MRDLEDLLEMGKRLEARPELMVKYAEGLLRVRDREGVGRPLKANAVQLTFERTLGRHNIVLKARQMGITTWVAGRFFLKTVTKPGVLTLQVAQTREAAEGIFRMVQRFWECLPEELREEPLQRSIANSGQMYFPVLDSEFRVVSAGDANAGRGLTVQNLHCSEVSRWPGDAGATLAGLRAALAPGGEMVMESTPNGAYGCFYEEWGRAEGNDVVRHFFPWWMEKAYVADTVTYLREDERALVLAHGLSAGQIGFRRGLEASYRGLRSQEFAEDAESCFKATGECCFEVEVVEARLREVPEPVEMRRGGALRVWLPAVPGKEYVVAVDTAGGGADGDFAAVQVIDVESGMQCAEMQQRLGTLELARVSADIAREYGGALIAVERNNHGAGVVAYLDSVERYARVYEQGGVAGWLTTAGNKPGMVSRMGALLVESPWLFFSKRLLGECRTFVSMAGGRTGAVSGAHDDCLMAMAVAQAVRAELLGKKSAGGIYPTLRKVREGWGARVFGGGNKQRKAQWRREQNAGVLRFAQNDRRSYRFVGGGCSILLGRGEIGLAVLAVQAIRRMRGGAQSQLMLGADGRLWVVKFQNNPQHLRVLANELIATRLAAAVGLTVPASDVVEVTDWLVTNSAEMFVELPRGERERYKAGLQFGSQFVGGLMPGQVVDYLPEQQLDEVRNLAEFAGMLCIDKWAGNCNGRQAVFERKPRERKYRATFIDQGFCFNAGDWTFPDSPLRGVYQRNRVYERVTGWESFEPWLSRVEAMKAVTLWEIAEAVPPEWYGGDTAEIEKLMEQMLRRQSRVRELIGAFRDSDRAPFPMWEKKGMSVVQRQFADVDVVGKFVM